MPFHLAEITEEDCTAFAILDEAATANWPLARAMEQGKASRREMFEQWFHGNRGKVPNEKWMKVVDSETGQMAAGALWLFPEETPQNTGVKAGDAAVGKDAKQQADSGDDIPPVFIERGQRWKKFQDEFIGNQPFACKTHSFLCLRPLD